MLNVVMLCRYAECRYAECCSASGSSFGQMKCLAKEGSFTRLISEANYALSWSIFQDNFFAYF